MTRSVGRKRLKTTGLLLSILMLVLWVFSVLFASYYISSQSSMFLGFGRIGFADSQLGNPGWACIPYYSRWRTGQMPWTEFADDFLGFGLPDRNWKLSGCLGIPIWLLVGTVGFPTAFLWWRDRRPKAGFCKVCKYDLTGNVSGTCPECGTAVGPETG